LIVTFYSRVNVDVDTGRKDNVHVM